MAHMLAWQGIALEVATELAVNETSPTIARVDADWETRGGDVVNEEIQAELGGAADGGAARAFRTQPGELRGYLTVVPETRWLKHADHLETFLDETIAHYEDHVADLAAILAAAGRMTPRASCLASTRPRTLAGVVGDGRPGRTASTRGSRAGRPFAAARRGWADGGLPTRSGRRRRRAPDAGHRAVAPRRRTGSRFRPDDARRPRRSTGPRPGSGRPGDAPTRARATDPPDMRTTPVGGPGSIGARRRDRRVSRPATDRELGQAELLLELLERAEARPRPAAARRA